MNFFFFPTPSIICLTERWSAPSDTGSLYNERKIFLKRVCFNITDSLCIGIWYAKINRDTWKCFVCFRNFCFCFFLLLQILTFFLSRNFFFAFKRKFPFLFRLFLYSVSNSFSNKYCFFIWGSIFNENTNTNNRRRMLKKKFLQTETVAHDSSLSMRNYQHLLLKNRMWTNNKYKNEKNFK